MLGLRLGRDLGLVGQVELGFGLEARRSAPAPMASTPSPARASFTPWRAPFPAETATERIERPRASSAPRSASAPKITPAPTTPVAAVTGIANTPPSTPPASRSASSEPSSEGRPYARWRIATSAMRSSRRADRDPHAWAARLAPRAPDHRRRRRDSRTRCGHSSTTAKAMHATGIATRARPSTAPVPSASASPTGPARSVQRPRAQSTPTTTRPTAAASARWPASCREAAARPLASAPGLLRSATGPRRATGSGERFRVGFLALERERPLPRVLVAGMPAR